MAEVSGPATYVSSSPNEEGDKWTMMKDPELAFGWSRYNLRLIGLWPYQTCNKNHQRLLMRYGPPVCSIWMLSFDMIPQVLAPSAYTFVREEMIALIGIEAGLIGGIVRIMVLWRNSEAMCLAFLSENWMRNFSTVDRETIMKNTKLVKRISIGVTLLVQCFCWSYVTTRGLLYLNLDDQNTTELGKQLFYPAYCPFDLRDRTNFAIVWGGQCHGLLWASLAYQGTDGFVAMLIIHLCGQMTILRYALINLIDGDNTLGHAKFRVKLRVSYLNATFIHLLIYCYIGNMLIQESETLVLASYSCKWYNLSDRSANDLKIVMCRARVPLQIWAGKFTPFSLPLSSNIMKTAMSYFSVLLTMKN